MALADPLAPDIWSRCPRAAEAAERAEGLPPGLLLAIGTVESGRRNPLTGQSIPWPYAVNVGGAGFYFATAEAAIAHVQAARATGVRSIDVGCFQVSLLHHPNAFQSLAEAFDPARNGAYAATFLSRLRAGVGSWEKAAGQYHSATPGLAEPYAAHVMAAWSGAARPLRPLPWRSDAVVRVYGPSGLLRGEALARAPAASRLPAVYVPGK